ncbi:hypothetical protein K8B33_12620 [Alcanivorax sp. JB21]|uniref:hypothetical protein n=1 Tax=Alcanivorax limicola TaxID=2874102 RepID=UPI001CBCC7D1|nr:hypothetical protein [Alcanivorax limicola]MBZ2189946.1 hypothetical protein [Alcanivorax limicola]
MTDAQRDKAEQLLNAQIAWIIAQLDEKEFKKLVKEEVNQFFKLAKTLKLNEVVSAEKVRVTARRYAIEMEISGAIPELIGEIADRLYNHPGHDKNSFEDLITDQEVAELLDVALEMKALRQRLISEIGGSPLTLNLISDMLYRGIQGFVSQGTNMAGNMAGNIPGASSLLKLGKSAVSRAAPGLEKSAETSIKKYIAHNTRSIIRQSEKRLESAVESGELRQGILDFWDEIKEEKVASLRRYITRDELEDVMVTGLEAWKQFRETRYFGNLLDAGVDFFFHKYGDTTLDKLVGEMGVTKKMVNDEIMHYAPDIIALLKEKGILEETLRRRLSPFWHADSTLALL